MSTKVVFTLLLVALMMVAAVMGRRLDLTGKSEEEETRIDDLVKEIPPHASLNDQVHAALMAKLYYILLGIDDKSRPSENLSYDIPSGFGVKVPSRRFDENSFSKRARAHGQNPWCNFLDIWKGQGSGAC